MPQRTFNLKYQKQIRSQLRTNMPKPEEILWQRIRRKQLGVKFRRQHGIGRYIVDFYCAELNLVIEIDGDSHFSDEGKEKDTKRDAFMETLGIKVVRFTNEEVMKQTESVLERLFNLVQSNNPL
ncbi:endonuclease domain-containing protein [Vibrio campbellii]|uniref:endonuclease domain-containing protein n=1 Tax=Vibrio campbellii TaxID=680 RepID=UPI00026C4B5B|nr:endonuclease domain-containing protein [Vibrio campbellii]AXB30830.1 endonuclease domain-containing protein [Vibrio campbellii]